jgi:RNase P subunit RPR2
MMIDDCTNAHEYREKRDRAMKFSERIHWCEQCGWSAPLYEWDRQFVVNLVKDKENYLTLTCSGCGSIHDIQTLAQEEQQDVP